MAQSEGGSGVGAMGTGPAKSQAGEVLCPYCGHAQTGSDASGQCPACRGLLEPLSRQATQNVMGPWQIRNERNPFAPGCSFEKLKEMVERGKVTRTTILRGPPTRQFWARACNVPGVAVLLGECHSCHKRVEEHEYLCRHCGAVLTCSTDRQHLGLAPVKLLPGDAPAHVVASSGMSMALRRPGAPATPPAVEPSETNVAPESQVVPRAEGAPGGGAGRTILLAWLVVAGMLAVIGISLRGSFAPVAAAHRTATELEPRAASDAEK